MAGGRWGEQRRRVYRFTGGWAEDHRGVPGPLVLAVEQRALLRVVEGSSVATHPQVDVVVVDAATRVALVLVDKVLLEEGYVDLLAPGPIEVDVLRERDRVAPGTHATGLAVDARMGDGPPRRGVVDVSVERHVVGHGLRCREHLGACGSGGCWQDKPHCQADGGDDRDTEDEEAALKVQLPEPHTLSFQLVRKQS